MSSPPIPIVVPGKASALYDGQFGSTGKGLAAAWVGEHNAIDWATTNASANAGHTTVRDGKATVLFHLPSSFLTARENGFTRVYINKGAIIDLEVLIREIEEIGARQDQVFVDPNAAIILPEDTEAERSRWSSQTKIASTQKGVGSALARKVERQGPNFGQFLRDLNRPVPFLCRPVDLNTEMMMGKSVFMEVPQGFSLSLSASGFYPYTTSRDCTLQQGLSDAGIHPRFFHQSLAVCRTLPIRVGNIRDDNGRQIGFSGHVYPDQYEREWSELGLEAEITTVTKRQRRIFTFSAMQYERMLRYNRPDHVFLNFCNYLSKTQVGQIVAKMSIAEMNTGVRPVHYYGYGPSSDHITEYVR